MPFPEHEWFSLREIAKRWGTTEEDLFRFAADGTLALRYRARREYRRGYDLEPLPSHYAERLVFRDRIREATAGVEFRLDRDHVVITREERDRFEQKCGMPQPVEADPTRPSQIAKAKCQAIAKALWDVEKYRDTTIADMARHSAILEYGGGKHYPGKNTLRGWLSEVAPEHVKQPGRPPKKIPVKG